MARFRLLSATVSDTGPRLRNEDYASLAAAPAGAAGRGRVAAVADGMGGAPGGREAAETAVEEFIRAYFATEPERTTRDAAIAAVDTANASILDRARKEPTLHGMGTTLTAVVLIEEAGTLAAHIVHVGDSGVFLLRDDTIRSLTTEHNLAYQGLPHLLTRSVGTAPKIEADYARVALQSRDRLLLCTDGVSGVLPPAAIASIIGAGTVEMAAKALVAAARDAGSSDNATALVLEAIEDPAAGK